MDALDRRLLDDFQRDFPLASRPYAVIGSRLGVSEREVIERLRALTAGGFVRRVGVVVTPQRIGAGMLVAMKLSQRRLGRVAAQIAAMPEVNHSYERVHPFNLWFVVTAVDAGRLEQVVCTAETLAGSHALRLPLVEPYHLDLGFALGSATGGTQPSRAEAAPRRETLRDDERALLSALQEGLPLDVAPYAMLAQAAGVTEADVIAAIERWRGSGFVRRIGIIVEHHRLGYRANAMVVWDVPDGDVSDLGRRIAATGLTTLCYRRERVLPDWPYNLYCMMHGKSRPVVLRQLKRLRALCDMERYPTQVLFSARQFKQQGARYVEMHDGQDRSRGHQSIAGRLPDRGAAVSRSGTGAGPDRGAIDRGDRATARAERADPIRPAV